MHGKEVARRRDRRADVVFRDDVNIVQQRIQSDYEKGTFWAGIALVLVLGPLMALGFVWGWL